MLFKDRGAAGKKLAQALLAYKQSSEVVILALPRGGVAVASEIARALTLPFDVFLVRKLGVPAQQELAFGAIASGGITYLNKSIIKSCALNEATQAQVIALEQKELKRRDRIYRQGRAFPELQDKTVILVDDGIATGATLLAAVLGLRQKYKPTRIVVAIPVSPLPAIEKLRLQVDEIICLSMPEFFSSIGQFYSNFEQIEDEIVLKLLGVK